jgi:hypothetical protein
MKVEPNGWFMTPELWTQATPDERLALMRDQWLRTYGKPLYEGGAEFLAAWKAADEHPPQRRALFSASSSVGSMGPLPWLNCAHINANNITPAGR